MAQAKSLNSLWVRIYVPLDQNWRLNYQVQRKWGKQGTIGCPTIQFIVIMIASLQYGLNIFLADISVM